MIYRCIGDNLKNGIVACGFMTKENAERSQYDFSNEFYSCFLLLRGSGEYITKEGEVIPLEAGDLVQRMPGVLHSTRVHPDGQWLEFFLSVGADFFETEKKLGVLPNAPVIKNAFQMVDIDSYFGLIARLKAAAQNELPILALELQKEILNLQGYGGVQKGNVDIDGRLQNACDLLTQNLEHEISMEKLAENIQMGYESFRKEFRREYGISPQKYRIIKRMEQACLLLESGIPIKDIARMVGYEDVYSFSKQFAKTYGIPPGQYRRQKTAVTNNSYYFQNNSSGEPVCAIPKYRGKA